MLMKWIRDVYYFFYKFLGKIDGKISNELTRLILGKVNSLRVPLGVLFKIGKNLKWKSVTFLNTLEN